MSGESVDSNTGLDATDSNNMEIERDFGRIHIEEDAFPPPSSSSSSSSSSSTATHFDSAVNDSRGEGGDIDRWQPTTESDVIAHALRIAAARTRTIVVFDFTRARDALENGTTMSMHVMRFVVPSHRPRLADLQVLSREIQRKLELEHETFTALLASLSLTTLRHCTTTAAAATIARAVRLKLANTLAQSALSLVDPGGTLELNAYFRKRLMPSFSHRHTPIYRATVELLEDMAIAFEADDKESGGAQRDKMWTLMPELAVNHHLNAFSLYSFAWYYHYSIGVREKYERKATLALTRAFLSASTLQQSSSSSPVSAASVIPAHAGCVLLAASIDDEAKRNSLIGKCKELSVGQQVFWMGELARTTSPLDG